MTNKNRGKFSFSWQFISLEPDRAAEVFVLLKLVPVRCEYMFDTDVFEYTGLSDKFEEVSPGDVTPEYELIIIHGDDGTVTNVEVVRL